MSPFSRVCLLAMSLALLLNISLGASVSWSFYSSNACNGTTVYTGTDKSALSSNGAYASGCQQTSALGSGISSVQLGCGIASVGNTTSNTNVAIYYSDASCNTQSSAGGGGSAGGGSGQCFSVSGISGVKTASVSCNAAFATATLSLPLMALLALPATVS